MRLFHDKPDRCSGSGQATLPLRPEYVGHWAASPKGLIFVLLALRAFVGLWQALGNAFRVPTLRAPVLALLHCSNTLQMTSASAEPPCLDQRSRESWPRRSHFRIAVTESPSSKPLF